MTMANANETFALGDIVALGWDDLGETCTWNDGYNHATVSAVHADGTINLYRPYTATADFSMSGGRDGSSAVICYVGIEEIKNRSTRGLKLLRKGSPLR
jgi:hypothetical protein